MWLGSGLSLRLGWPVRGASSGPRGKALWLWGEGPVAGAGGAQVLLRRTPGTGFLALSLLLGEQQSEGLTLGGGCPGESGACVPWRGSPCLFAGLRGGGQ